MVTKFTTKNDKYTFGEAESLAFGFPLAAPVAGFFATGPLVTPVTPPLEGAGFLAVVVVLFAGCFAPGLEAVVAFFGGIF